jgi:flagellar motor switch protein FliN/FliY
MAAEQSPDPAASTTPSPGPAPAAPSEAAPPIVAGAASATPATEPAQVAAAPSPVDSAPAPVAAAPAALDAESLIDQASIDELLRQASFEDPSAFMAAGAGAPSGFADAGAAMAAAAIVPDTSNFQLPNFQQVMQDAQVSSIDLLRDVELNVKIELGRSRMLVEDVLKLSEGSVVELDKLAGDPVDVFVNDRLVARGEVLVLNDNFCVRVNEIVAGVKEEGM